MAGNLTLIGSASNIIVATNSKEEATIIADKAKRERDRQNAIRTSTNAVAAEEAMNLVDSNSDSSALHGVPMEKLDELAKIDLTEKEGGLVDFNAKRHAKFGVPLTLLTCSVGVAILYVELKVLKWTI